MHTENMPHAFHQTNMRDTKRKKMWKTKYTHRLVDISTRLPVETAMKLLIRHADQVSSHESKETRRDAALYGVNVSKSGALTICTEVLLLKMSMRCSIVCDDDYRSSSVLPTHYVLYSLCTVHSPDSLFTQRIDCVDSPRLDDCVKERALSLIHRPASNHSRLIP